MGTHPIFESDFDCLTDSTGLINQNGSYLCNRRRYHEALSLKDVQSTCPTQAHQNCNQGRKEGSWRCYRNTTQLFPSEEKFKVMVKKHSANTSDLSDLASL